MNRNILSKKCVVVCTHAIIIAQKSWFFSKYAFAVFSGNYSCLQVALEWRRDLSQYWSDLFLPDMVLVATSFLTFWLDWSSVPARAILGMYYFIWTALFVKFTEFHALKICQNDAVQVVQKTKTLAEFFYSVKYGSSITRNMVL